LIKYHKIVWFYWRIDSWNITETNQFIPSFTFIVENTSYKLLKIKLISRKLFEHIFKWEIPYLQSDSYFEDLTEYEIRDWIASSDCVDLANTYYYYYYYYYHHYYYRSDCNSVEHNKTYDDLQSQMGTHNQQRGPKQTTILLEMTSQSCIPRGRSVSVSVVRNYFQN
jgi:hypothetical protein